MLIFVVTGVKEIISEFQEAQPTRIVHINKKVLLFWRCISVMPTLKRLKLPRLYGDTLFSGFGLVWFLRQ